MAQAVYRLLDHTADLRVRLEADSLEGLFQCAVDAIRDLCLEDPAVQGKREPKRIQAQEEAADIDEALVLFCNDVLYELVVHRLVPWRLLALSWTPGLLEAAVEASPLPPDAALERELKAATHGGVEVIEQNGHWSAVLVFDV